MQVPLRWLLTSVAKLQTGLYCQRQKLQPMAGMVCLERAAMSLPCYACML